MNKQKQIWLETELYKKRKSFTNKKKFFVSIFTCNLKEQNTIEDCLFLRENTEKMDIVVLCFQNSKMDLETKVRKQLEQSIFKIVIDKTDGNLFTIVALAVKHVSFFQKTSVYINKHKTKEGRVLCIGIELYETKICFINSLVLEETLEKRNKYCDEITKNSILKTNKNKELSVEDFLFLFLIGSLNYQIILSQEEIKKNQFDFKYVKYDQLVIEKIVKRVLSLFKEGEITFPPSKKQQNKFFESNQIFSYNNRILWKKNKNISCLQYKEIKNKKLVWGLYSVIFRNESKSKKEEIIKNLVRKQDEYENNLIPKVSVSPTVIVLGDLFYLKRIFFFFTIHNTGNVFSEYSIEENSKPSWIHFNRTNGILYPNQKERIVFSVCIKKDSCFLMNKNNLKPECVIIVRIKDGGERFVHFTGRFNKTAFCIELDSAEEKRIETNVDTLSAPKILWKMLNHLAKGIETKDLFIKTAPKCLIYEVVRCLDKEEEFLNLSENGFRAVACSVVLFFQSLPSPLITEKCQMSLLDSKNLKEITKAIKILPQRNIFVFYYLLSFFEFLLSKNKTVSADFLSSLFGGILFGLEEDKNKKKRTKAASVLFWLLRRKN